MLKSMKRQATLFPEKENPVLKELDLRVNQVKSAVSVYCEKIEIAGSIKRQKPLVHDIDFVAVAKSDIEWKKISEELKRMKAKQNCSGSSIIKAFLPIQNGLFQADFYRAKPSTFGIHLLIRTGSAEHNMWLAGYAISQGMRLKYSEGLIKEDSVIAGEDEKGVFEALGLPCPMPSQREIVNNKPLWISPKSPSP